MGLSDQYSRKTDGAPGAGQLPLFYTNPVALDANQHRDVSLKRNFGLGFAAEVNAVPVNLIEMPQVCHYYPIAFSPDERGTPVAVLGLRDGENLFLNARNEWLDGAYVPAYIRRYPFIFSEIPGTDQLTLCMDLTPDTAESGGEQRIFTPEGTATPLAQSAIEFCKAYHGATLATLEFGQAMAKSGILVDRTAQVTLQDGRKINFSGFRVVDEEKLAALDDATFLEWRKRGWLPFLYAHLFSSAQWQLLTRLLNERQAA